MAVPATVAAIEHHAFGGTTSNPLRSTHDITLVSTVLRPRCTPANGRKKAPALTTVPTRYGVQLEAGPPMKRLVRLSIAVVVVGADVCPVAPVNPRAKDVVVFTVVIPKPTAT